MTVAINTCLSCDEPLRSEARYCVSCGVATQLVGETETDVDHVVVLGAPAGPASRDVDGGRDGGRDGRAVRVLLTVGVTVGVAMVAWLIFAPQTETVSGVAHQLQAIDRRVPAGWADASANGQADLVLSPRRQGEESAGSDASREMEVTTRFLPDPDRAGRELWAATSDLLVRIDLATLDQRQVEIPGPVVAGNEQQLVLDVQGEGLMVAPVDDPFAATLVFDDNDGHLEISDLTIDDEGRLLISYWDHASSPTDFRADPDHLLVAIDLETGERFDLDIEPAGWNLALGLSWGPGIGTVETLDGSGRILSDGYPIASGSRMVLIERCDRPTECEELWVDRKSGEVLDDRHLPDTTNRWFQVVPGTDRYLAVEGNHPTYYDAETGREIPSPEADSRSSSGRGLVEISSEDGYLFVPGRSVLYVYDPETADYSRIDLQTDGTVSFLDLHSVNALERAD